MNISRDASPLTRQLIALHESGLSPEDICTAMPELTPEAVELAIKTATTGAELDFDKLVDSKRELAVAVLESIMLDADASDMARVKAANLFIERKGCSPTLEADEMSEIFKRREALKAKNTAKLLVLPTVVKDTDILAETKLKTA